MAKEAVLPELWTCLKCGAQFISKNLWHSCVTGLKVEDLFARSEPQVLKIFREFEKLVRACGPVTRIVQKSRLCSWCASVLPAPTHARSTWNEASS